MTTDERFKIYYEYRYLIDNELQKHSSNNNDIEQIMDAVIAGLFIAIDDMPEDIINVDFKMMALFHSKNQTNNILSFKD